MGAHNEIGKVRMHLILRQSGALKFQKWAKDFKIGAKTQPRLNPAPWSSRLWE